MRRFWILSAAAALLAAGPALSQDRDGKKPPECDLKTTEKVAWCPKCDRVLPAEELDKDGNHKGDCATKAKEIELCVKKIYACCRVESVEPGKCLCGKPLVEKADRAKVLFQCPVCGGKSPVETDVLHEEGKHRENPEMKVKRVCEKSGISPHIAAGG